MNITKEYIHEADCKEIQGLRKDLENGDWLSFKGIVDLYTFRDYLYNRDSILWLPLGDQLDDEIVKICDKRNYVYHLAKEKLWIISVVGEITSQNSNPLIAKIKLLKALLKEQ